MADREESIHVKIHLELSEEDENALKTISGDVGKADTEEIKEQKEQDELSDQVESWAAGNVGKFQNFTSQQFNNVKSVATNPAMFMIKGMFGKFAKAGVIVGLALMFVEIVKFALDELMAAGRPLDRRFKLLADKQILLFTERREQQELRQAIGRTAIVTSIPSIRGAAVQGNLNGNIYTYRGANPVPAHGYEVRLLTTNTVVRDHRAKSDMGSFKNRYSKK